MRDLRPTCDGGSASPPPPPRKTVPLHREGMQDTACNYGRGLCFTIMFGSTDGLLPQNLWREAGVAVVVPVRPRWRWRRRCQGACVSGGDDDDVDDVDDDDDDDDNVHEEEDDQRRSTVRRTRYD
ncbi:hypothetical protein G5I_01998 [Acromyrmex echinatior]|uniref:Uncharacterized protein n=1 Tax=Acromyrmex echinatior TaxID=103372 RepID=F4W951_ACREC|nr:hypothetical protein G5I_01998 [Acromyrmex echinatior]